MGTMLANFAAFLIAISYWEVFLYDQINGSLKGFPAWALLFAPAEAMVCAFITGWIRSRIISRIWSTIVMLAVWFFYAAQLVYHRIFGSLFSVSMVSIAGNAVTDFRWALLSELKRSVAVLLISLLPIFLFILAMLLLGLRSSCSARPHAAALVLAAVFWAIAALLLPSFGTDDTSTWFAYHSKLIDTDTAASRLGILPNALIETKNLLMGTAQEPEPEPEPNYAAAPDADDTEPMDLDLSPNMLGDVNFRKLSEKANSSSIKALCDLLAQDKGTAKNGYTGLFEGHDLIYICGEAFSSLAIDEKATPTLWKLSHEGIVLSNYYNSFINWTTNGEFALLTGLWPDVSRDASSSSGNGSMIRSAKHLMPFGLGNVFNEQCGITSRAYHNYEGYYYQRNKSLPNLGFECKFMNDGMTFTTKWPASDLEMMEQSIPDYIDDERFCVYYMTFSGHGPYNSANVIRNRNIDTVKELLEGSKLSDEAKSYIACNYELDKALAYLLEEIEKAGRLETTVIVLAGDHYPYNLDYDARDELAGHKLDNTFEMYENTCIIWSGMLRD
ncbi:MAG: sulfatase-like hydrolase/transferase, partial [Firmicutes bacterium]|nr:sulfatase-like hydrolase/transferase [Bacillota bacterium]